MNDTICERCGINNELELGTDDEYGDICEECQDELFIERERVPMTIFNDMMNDKPGRLHEVTLEELESLAPLPTPEFQGWPKIPRLLKDMVITEKIDGTNAQILVGKDGSICAGSRKRWLHVGDDNHGFGKWVNENKNDLRRLLGPGRHFGEWWGQGIQRRYDMDYKVFSLFNIVKWDGMLELNGQLRVVPVLDTRTFNTFRIHQIANTLKLHGSYAAPGFMNPEGICIFHIGASQIFKLPFEDK